MLSRPPQNLNHHEGYEKQSKWQVLGSLGPDVIALLTDYIIGLIGHLKQHFPVMYRLFCTLKDRVSAPTSDEIEIASGRKTLDNVQAQQYLKKLETASENILKAFQRQTLEAAVSVYLFFFHFSAF